jgi:hypothetical protein
LIQRFSSYDATADVPLESKILPLMPRNYAKNLLYLRYRHRSNTQGPNLQTFPLASQYPEWLRICQMFMTEGLEIFMLNAEWYFNGYSMNHRDLEHWSNTSFQLDTSKVTIMHLYVEDLANFEIPYRYKRRDTRLEQECLANLMRKTNMRVKEMRFVGYSYRLHPGNESCGGQVDNMMRNLVGIFHSIGVSKWEFGVVQPQKSVGLWLLYDWVVESGKSDEEGSLKRMVRALQERRVKKIKPENDLEKLLPEGWVKKRPECVCVDCREEREEMGTGGWGPRPDQFGDRAKEPWERRYTWS